MMKAEGRTREELVHFPVPVSKCRFYYLRDRNNRRVVTVCILPNEDTKKVDRGISICSPLDAFNAKEGRNKARGRAVKAFVNQASDLPVSEKTLDMLADRGLGEGTDMYWLVPFKSSFNVSPTHFEEKILGWAK